MHRSVFLSAIAAYLAVSIFRVGSAGAAETSAPPVGEWEKTVAAAKKEGVVSVYLWQGGNLERAVQVFQKKYPEIRLSLVGGRGSGFILRIATEIRAGKHLADTCICGVTSPYKILYEQLKAFDPIKSTFILPEVKDESKWWQGKHHFQDPEGKYIFAYRGDPAGTRTFYNTQLVNPKEFKSYWDLLNPKWKGKMIAIDPNESSGGWRIFYYNPQIGPEFLRRLFGEMDLTLSRDDRQSANWLAVGKFALGFFLTGITEGKGQGLPVDELSQHNMKEPPALYTGPNGTIALLKNAPHPNAAKLFINWFLSREGQTALQEIMNTPLDQVESMREDIPKDPVPSEYRRRSGVDYVPMFTPERMDSTPLLKLFKETYKR